MHRGTTIATLALLSLITVSAHGQTVVDLIVANALRDTDIHGYSSGAPAPTQGDGMTFNVTFTPAAGDLDSNLAGVNLIEVGGDANGTGLYLLGGEVHFLSKMNGVAGNAPGAFNDLDFSSGNNMIGAKSSFGALDAGKQYAVAAVYDPLGSGMLELALLEEGIGPLHVDSFALSGVGGKTNWNGDNSFTALQGVGGNGGGLNTVGGNPFSEALVNGNPFEGVQAQGLYWNDLGDFLEFAAVPEPASIAIWSLLGLGLAGLGYYRTRRKK